MGAKGVVHVGWEDGYFPDEAQRLEALTDESASWQLSGYRVTLMPNDGQEHLWNEPCPACKPADPG